MPVARATRCGCRSTCGTWGRASHGGPRPGGRSSRWWWIRTTASRISRGVTIGGAVDRMKRIVWALLLALGLFGALYASRGASPARLAPPAARAQDASTRPEWADIGFRDREHLEEHFRKHGAEFGAATAEDYLRLARRLRDRPVGPDLLESVRADGTVTRYDRTTHGFIAFERDGTIRTFFRPNDGEAYF